MEWFNKIKNKAQYFTLGLMAGLLVGGGFFIFKLDDYFKQLRSYKNALQEQQSPIKDEKDKEVEKISRAKKNKTYARKNDSSNNALSESDSVGIENKDLTTGKLIPVDSSTNIALRDTTPNNTFSVNENVIIRKDELVASKTVEVLNFNTIINSSEEKKDSLLQKISGIKEDAVKTSYKVEIWNSPLNYKGYKMTKNKIILYGIVNYENIKLYQLHNEMYVKTILNTYKIEYSSEFKPLEKVSDESVLAKLK